MGTKKRTAPSGKGDVSPPPSVIASRIYKKRHKAVNEVTDEHIFEGSSPAHVMHPGSESNVQHDRPDYIDR